MFGLGPTVYVPCKVARVPVPLGGWRPPGLLLPIPVRTPIPALSPGRPHLSGQEEFPFFSLPQLHHVGQGLNRCTNTKIYTAFLMHGKETLPVSLSSPLHPPHQNKSPFPSRSEATQKASRGYEHNGRVYARGPGDREARACRVGESRAGGLIRRAHFVGRSALASRSIWGGHLQDGSWAARLGEQSCRKPGRGGALARATQSGGCAGGARGAAHKDSGARTASGPRRGP